MLYMNIVHICFCIHLKKKIPSGKHPEVDLLDSMIQFSSVQSLSHVQLFCNPMDCITPGFPVHHQHPELAQTHVYPVGDGIQQSHPLLSPIPPAFNLSLHQSLFQ